MDSAECVRNYKSLAHVERAFRSLKTIDLKVRPIHHRLADRVRAHILLCMLAYYVEWHMRAAWRELMFADTDQPSLGHARSGRASLALQSRAGQGGPPHIG
jgi:transposase